jgi:hypothetical protein
LLTLALWLSTGVSVGVRKALRAEPLQRMLEGVKLQALGQVAQTPGAALTAELSVGSAGANLAHPPRYSSSDYEQYF